MQDGKAYSKLRSTDCRQLPKRYEPGVIFSAPFHTQYCSPAEVSLTDPNLTASPFGTIFSKFRKSVVLTVSEDGGSCAAVPIYSHNGEGLKFKPSKHEYVSIRDVEDEKPQDRESKHGLLWCHRDLQYSAPKTFISGKSSVHLTELVTHRLGAPATIEGSLTAPSLEILRELVKKVHIDSL